MDWSNLSGVLTGVLTISAIIFGGLFGLQRANLTSLQTRADENSKAATDLRATLVDLRTELGELRTEYAEIHGENELLKRINSGTVEWTAIQDFVQHHHDMAEEHWRVLAEDLAKVTHVLRQVAEETVGQREILKRLAEIAELQTRAIRHEQQ